MKAPWNVQGKPAQKRAYRRAVRYPHHLPVRVSAAEREAITAAARGAGLSVSRYVAKAITEGRYPPAVSDREALFRLCFLLEKAGVNLNQIAKQLNGYQKGAPVVPPTLAQVRGAAKVVGELSRRIAERMG